MRSFGEAAPPASAAGVEGCHPVLAIRIGVGLYHAEAGRFCSMSAHSTHISVIGCGYLGATHAAVLAGSGFTVIGIELDAHKVDVLQSGRAPFHEPGLNELLSIGVASGHLRFSTDPHSIAGASVHFLCVGTPQLPGSDAYDLSALEAAVTMLLPHLRPGHVVVGKSTVPVGTAEEIRQRVVETGCSVVWNPEFLREGHAVIDSVHPDRIVLGVHDDDSHGVSVMRDVYKPQIESGSPVVVVDLPTAELVKAAANSFLAMKVSFINAVGEVCALAGARVDLLAHAIGLDERIGPHFLRSGLGFGGGCLPKDIRGLAHRSLELGASGLPALLEVTDRINLAARTRAADAICRHSSIGSRVVVLGAAFKPESDDLRDSPALALARALVKAERHVTVCDPVVDLAVLRAVVPGAHVMDAIAALRGAEVVALATEWDEYLALDPAVVGGLVKERVVFDGRSALDRASWEAEGFAFIAC